MAPRLRRALSCALAGLVASSAASVVAAAAPSYAAPGDRSTPAPSAVPDPAVDLDEPARGRAAVRELGADLPAAAAANDMRAGELEELLLEDSTAWVDEGGRVFFVEPAHATVEESAPVAASSAPYLLSDTFRLHSKPGSARTIYLDFDGATVSETAWNSSGLPAGTYEGWSLDSSPDFNDHERATIQGVWQRVAEDYAPFDVDVTTAAPADDLIRRTDRGDQVFGTRVLISDSTAAQTAICGGGCGGVAYIDVFDEVGYWHDYFQPAWVFPRSTGDSSKGIAEAVSHEVGHNLALFHDGRTSPDEDYYAGHGIWAPIMGVGYYRAVTQWSRGSYGAASNGQDDLAVITSSGLGYRADEAGSTIASAAPGPPASTAHISTATDSDVYALAGCAGTVTVAAHNAPTSPNLDLGMQLWSGSGTVVASAAPRSGPGTPDWDVTTGTDAALTATVPDGTYYVSVDGTGDRTWSDGGYDDYGSVGAYTLSVNGCGATLTSTSTPSASRPSEPRIIKPRRGGRGRPWTATARWAAPSSTGGATITRYVVRAHQLNRRGRVVRTKAKTVSGSARAKTFRLRKGKRYRFSVRALNSAGYSAYSARSRVIRPR